MARHNSNGPQLAAIARRREMVARLRARLLTVREVQGALAQPEEQGGLRDPKTGQPYALTTIARDCKALEQEWRENAKADVAEHKARLLAELQEIARIAATDKNLKAWLQADKQQADLLGVNAPVKVAPTNPTGEKAWRPQEPVDLSMLSDEELGTLEQLKRKIAGTQP